MLHLQFRAQIQGARVINAKDATGWARLRVYGGKVSNCNIYSTPELDVVRGGQGGEWAPASLTGPPPPPRVGVGQKQCLP